MRHRSLDLVIASGLALIGILVAWIGPKNPDQVNSLPLWFAPIGIAIALVLPGYSIAAGLFPQFDGAGVFLLSLGLSLAADVVGALLLNFTPWGLTPLSWTVLLGIVTFGGSLNTVFRRRVQLATTPEIKDISPPFTWRVGAVFVIAVLIVVVAVGVSFLGVLKDQKSFTQLWTIPAVEDGMYALQIGIKSEELQTVHYDLYIEESGVKLNEFDDIEMLPGQTWTTTVQLDQYPEAEIHVYLYWAGTTKDAYRMVQIAPISFNYVMTPTPTAISP
jgi:uncharacterized membrane protein